MAWVPQVRAEGGGAAPYLRAGAGARGVGMGGAQTAAADDASAAYWNPGKLPFLAGDRVLAQTSVLGWERAWNFLGFTHADVNATGGSYAYAGTWINFSAGSDLEAREENRPLPDHMFSDSENALLLSLASGLGPGLGVGSNLKLLLQSLDGTSASGFGLDLAVWHQLDPDWSWGLMLQDVYSSLNWPGGYQDRVPWLIRAGVMYQLGDTGLRASCDADAEYLHAPAAVRNYRYHAGVEYQALPALAVRTGLDNGRWTAGASGNFRLGERVTLQLDYALATERMPGEGLNHVFSLAVSW
ncbi:MAG: hypothetical protein AB1439_12715 [candidate division FCPU426 bacterium]